MRLAMIVATAALAACGEVPPTQTASLAPPERWDAHLLQLMPSIDRCIRDARDARWVTYAGEQNGLVLVRLSNQDGAFDCRVSEPIVDVRPRDGALRIEGEGKAIFVRGPGQNPGGECYEAPEVRDANGALLGWMADPEGC